MKKFTIFTIILTIVVVVVLAELMAKDYIPGFSTDTNVATDQSGDMKLTLPTSLDTKKSIATNVLGSDGTDFNKLGADNTVVPADTSVTAPITLPTQDATGAIDTTAKTGGPDFLDPNNFSDPTATTPAKKTTTQSPTQTTNTSGVKDFEDENAATPVVGNVYLRDEQIKSAGFTGGYLEDEPLDGRLFKTIDISDLKDTEVTKTDIRSKDEILAKVYIFKVGIGNSADEVYKTLKLKASQGLNVKLNETNEFGSASFFMNDPVRSDTAFLVVRISGLVYSFSYPKTYHSQVKNLIQLISWELG
ncbi:MAG: hypothetical protein NTZ25_02925 [Candidatus Peregrinibacteria bacterium]|nr:hypothetical protein [Candidatus Peregrinibacteria bacterium]